MLARVRAVARAIEARVRNALKDTDSDAANAAGGTAEQPPLPDRWQEFPPPGDVPTAAVAAQASNLATVGISLPNGRACSSPTTESRTTPTNLRFR